MTKTRCIYSWGRDEATCCSPQRASELVGFSNVEQGVATQFIYFAHCWFTVILSLGRQQSIKRPRGVNQKLWTLIVCNVNWWMSEALRMAQFGLLFGCMLCSSECATTVHCLSPDCRCWCPLLLSNIPELCRCFLPSPLAGNWCCCPTSGDTEETQLAPRVYELNHSFKVSQKKKIKETSDLVQSSCLSSHAFYYLQANQST